MTIKKINWKPEYATRIELFDEQHKKIVTTYNDFCDKVNDKNYSKEDIVNFINELDSYAKNHFETEEKIMKKENFPQTHEHKKRHKFFNAIYTEVKENKFLRNDAEMLFVINLTEITLEWLESHLTTYDKEFTDFLKERGYS